MAGKVLDTAGIRRIFTNIKNRFIQKKDISLVEVDKIDVGFKEIDLLSVDDYPTSNKTIFLSFHKEGDTKWQIYQLINL